MRQEKKCPKCTTKHNKKGIFCSRKCANSRSWSDLDKLKKSIAAKNSEIVKEANIRNAIKNTKGKLNKVCPICKKIFEIFPYSKKIFCSVECFREDKNSGKYCKKLGGCRYGSGRGKSGWYNGYWCDSTWELAFVIYNLEHDIKFERNKQDFSYKFEDKDCRFYPDFIIGDKYYEIKGYFDKKNNAKIAQFNNKLVILGKEEIKKYINYTKDKYGNNFVELYEENPHKIKLNKCLICGREAKYKYCSRSCSGKAVSKVTNWQGSKWINNGKENRKINLEEDVLDGYTNGRIRSIAYCPVCGEERKNWLKTCSIKCAAKLKEKIDWSKIDLQEMNKSKTIVQIAKELNVGRTVIIKRLKIKI